jgi:hypothetical protein
MAIILVQGFTGSMFASGSGERTGGERGLILGFCASNFVGSETNNKFIPGITLGFYQKYNINHRFGLETGLLFTTKGSRLDAVGDLYMYQIVTYMEVPVLAEWTLYSVEKAKIFLAGGSFFGLQLIAFNEVGFPDEIQRFDVGVDLRAGVKFRYVSYMIEVKRGLLNIDKSESPANYKNLSLSLIARIPF